ncbi:hypothetical protein PS876_04690 [Pseudomonas fluorescens]|uniref:hypothetical protein n=1 Tax=Pseudomonas fluorescens TaxID=294 RepID=UPI00124200AF|nr:hypothetical protein [Pseudomonas fluorescens]VVP37955.1 hypothetical protein PS876_04690 [Pseudomonas fluorescens]
MRRLPSHENGVFVTITTDVGQASGFAAFNLSARKATCNGYVAQVVAPARNRCILPRRIGNKPSVELIRGCYAVKGLKVLYNFHPVGQGVFSSGMLAPDDGSNKHFWWVFDCGTHLKRHHARRDAEIDNLVAMIGAAPAARRPRIDLVFISHFDKDHVNGLLKLLERFEVGRLVLPFIPLHERLHIAFSGKSVQRIHPWQLFIIAPSRYIQGADGIQVDRLTVVLPSGSDGPRDDNDSDTRPWDEDPIDIVPPPSETPEEIRAFDNFDGAGIRIEWLAQGASLKVGNVWEFVLYNDPSTIVRATPPFRQHAKQLADQMINATCDATRAVIKDQIVALYAVHHGTTAPEKNLISLFVYAGPLLKPKQVLLCSSHYRYRPPYYSKRQRITHAILYTGDGFLKKPVQLSDMLNYFGSARINRPKVVQVMHHGSRSSWHQGVADALAPEYSIFCAYRHGLYFHPHGDVWEDFEGYGRWICGEHAWEKFWLYQRLRI